MPRTGPFSSLSARGVCKMEPPTGIEPASSRLRGGRSTLRASAALVHPTGVAPVASRLSAGCSAYHELRVDGTGGTGEGRTLACAG